MRSTQQPGCARPPPGLASRSASVPHQGRCRSRERSPAGTRSPTWPSSRGRFERMLEEFGAVREREWPPAVDVVRDDDRRSWCRADVPGIKPEEIKIEIREGLLTLSGEHEEAKEEKDEQYVRRERRSGAFSRGIPLPDGVEAKKIKARTHDGVLEVTVPLPKEAAKEPITITPTVECARGPSLAPRRAAATTATAQGRCSPTAMTPAARSASGCATPERLGAIAACYDDFRSGLRRRRDPAAARPPARVQQPRPSNPPGTAAFCMPADRGEATLWPCPAKWFAPHAAPPAPGAHAGLARAAPVVRSADARLHDHGRARAVVGSHRPGPRRRGHRVRPRCSGARLQHAGHRGIGHRTPDDRRDAARRARRTPPGSRRLGLPVQLRRAGPTNRRAPAERSRARARGGDGGLRRGGRPGDPARVRERQLPRAAQCGGGRPRAAPPGVPGAGPRRCGAPARRGRADPYGCRDGSTRRRPPRRSRRAPAAAAGDQGRARLRAARHRGGDRGAREDVPPDRSRGARARADAGSRRRAVRRRPSDRRRQGPLRADPGGRGLAGAAARGRDRQPRALHRHDGAARRSPCRRRERAGTVESASCAATA